MPECHRWTSSSGIGPVPEPSGHTKYSLLCAGDLNQQLLFMADAQNAQAAPNQKHGGERLT
eukprot:COSAG04_NODE_28940_length_272_cov_0.745665_1_plen_60_part_10